MNKTLITLLAAVFAVGFASADSASSVYVGGSPSGLVGLTTSATTLVVAGSEFGGARFAANAAQPLSVSVEDSTGNPVYFTACQDVDASSICDETEPSVSGCGAPIDISSFSATLDVIVFVYSTDLGVGNACIGTATTGSVIIDYA